MQPWFEIYANDPHWVPPLLIERKRFFDPRRNPYFEVADVQCFVAPRRRDVGTIAAVVDHAAQVDRPGPVSSASSSRRCRKSPPRCSEPRANGMRTAA